MKLDYYAKEERNMRALQIAVVDDMASDREWLTGKLEAYMQAHHIRYTLSAFTSGEGFLSALSEHWFEFLL